MIALLYALNGGTDLLCDCNIYNVQQVYHNHKTVKNIFLAEETIFNALLS